MMIKNETRSSPYFFRFSIHNKTILILKRRDTAELYHIKKVKFLEPQVFRLFEKAHIMPKKICQIFCSWKLLSFKTVRVRSQLVTNREGETTSERRCVWRHFFGFPFAQNRRDMNRKHVRDIGDWVKRYIKPQYSALARQNIWKYLRFSFLDALTSRDTSRTMTTY